MNIQQIRDVVDLIASSQVAEVEIKSQGNRIRVKNRTHYHSEQDTTIHQSALSSDNSPADATLDVSPLALDNPTAHTIIAKHIGKFKLAADAISQPVVKIGDTIHEGDTVAYVASLSQLLPVVSDKAGIVADILLSENDKVEYGTPVIALQ